MSNPLPTISTSPQRAVRSLAIASFALLLGACNSLHVSPDRVVTTSTSRCFAWTTASDGQNVLVEINNTSDLEIIQELDRGEFLEILGPHETPGGVAWARRAPNEEWRVSEIGVAPTVSRRSASRGDALSAMWHIERIAAGHAPGNAAELATLRPFAQSDRWPR